MSAIEQVAAILHLCEEAEDGGDALVSIDAIYDALEHAQSPHTPIGHR